MRESAVWDKERSKRDNGVKDAGVLPAWLKDHPLTLAVLRDERTKINKQRTAAKNEIDRLRREGAGVIPGMEKELETAKKEYEAAILNAEAVLDKCRELSRKLYSMKLSIEGQINDHEAFLRKSCDAEIDEAVMFFQNELERLRLPGTLSISAIKKNQKNPLNYKQEIDISSNLKAVEAATAYCREALDELEAMKLLPELDIKRIEELRKNVPRSDVFTYQQVYGHSFL